MSTNVNMMRVTISPSDDNFAPPEHEIDFSIIGNDLLITVYKGSLEDLNEGRTKEFEVPPIAMADLMRALSAFGDGTSGFRFERTGSAA